MEFKREGTKTSKAGLSKVCSLHPCWCVTVDSPGVHSMCVCEIHQKSQNLKLMMVVALPGTIDYKCQN